MADKKKPLKIGIGARNTAVRRVAYGLPVKDTRFAQIGNLPWHRWPEGDPRRGTSHKFRPAPSVDLYHLWNGVCFNRKRWITSFEAGLPLAPAEGAEAWVEAALEQVRSSYCKRLLALSEFGRDLFLSKNAGRIDRSVSDKTQVFGGAVDVDEGTLNQHRRFLKDSHGELVVAFVAHDFFRKGGVPLLRAVQRLKARCKGLRLLVIGRIDANDPVTGVTGEDAEKIKEELRSGDGIEWHATLTHTEVMKKTADAHLFASLPLDDNYGWSALEAMGVGLPVLTTNVCAMPELVEDTLRGAVLELPLTDDRRWDGMRHEPGSPERARAVEEAYEKLTDQLEQRIAVLHQFPDDLEPIGEAAADYVKANHDPRTLALRLREIYKQAIEE